VSGGLTIPTGDQLLLALDIVSAGILFFNILSVGLLFFWQPECGALVFSNILGVAVLFAVGHPVFSMRSPFYRP
jgi:small-conductance mechanosensitive channel